MIATKRKPVAVGTILVEEFLEPMGLTQTELAERSGLPRKHVNELCRDRRAVTADTALILSPRLRQLGGLLAQHAASYRHLRGVEHTTTRGAHRTGTAD